MRREGRRCREDRHMLWRWLMLQNQMTSDLETRCMTFLLVKSYMSKGLDASDRSTGPGFTSIWILSWPFYSFSCSCHHRRRHNQTECHTPPQPLFLSLSSFQKWTQ